MYIRANIIIIFNIVVPIASNLSFDQIKTSPKKPLKIESVTSLLKIFFCKSE